MKHIIKKIDGILFGGALRIAYLNDFLPFVGKFQYPKITPLPKNVNENFGLKARLDFFQSVQYYLQVNRINGVYLEFGCHELNTFRMALNTLGSYGKPNQAYRFYAFDSFEGMPEPEGIDKQKIWRAGMNATSLEMFYKTLERDLERVEAIKGFYQESLQKFKLPSDSVVALAYIDCDYYSSTTEVLKYLKNNLSHGMIIAFDDWDCYYGDPARGQRKAFGEFQEQLSDVFRFVEFHRMKSGGMSFICHEVNKVGLEIP